MATFEATDSSVAENEARFSYQHHAQKLLANLNETRKNPDLCDAYVDIEGLKISVQKSVLSAASQYLRALFSYDGNLTKHNGKTCINLRLSASTFHSIIDYIYTGEIRLTVENIQDVLQAADLFLLADLKDMCCEFLEGCFSPHNCLGIRDFTAQLSCPWIHLKVTQYLDEHISEVVYGEEYLRMSAEDVQQLMSRDTIQLKSEENVAESIFRWCRLDMANRQQHLCQLINSCVRCDISASPNLLHLVSEDMDQEVMAKVTSVLQAKQGELSCPRGYQQVIIVCGGEGQVNKTSEEVEVKAVTRFVQLRKSHPTAAPNIWWEMAPMNTPRIEHGLVEVGGFLFAVGGRDHRCCILNTAEKYDPNTNTWTPIAPMEHGRVGFGLVAIDDNIYALGGSNDMTDPLTSMEVYNIFTNRWKPLPDMTLKRVWCAYAASADRKIYVIAGGIVSKFYEAVECFDTRTLTWYSVSPMRERRCDARAVAVDNDVYVFGGYRRLECPSAFHSGHSLKLCGMEMYASRNDYWVSLHNRYGSPGLCAAASENSSLCGALYDGEDILVVGALDMGGDRFDCVRAFNRQSNTWHTAVAERPQHQLRYQCCLLNMHASVVRRLQQQQEELQQHQRQLQQQQNLQ